MIRQAFKAGDLVFYGVIRGRLIGIFNSDQCLFFSHDQRGGFGTREQITKPKASSSRIIDYLLNEHFGNKITTNQVLNQHRFAIVSLQDLKHMSKKQIDDESERLTRKRNLFIKMAHSYMRTRRTDETIHRVCLSIETIQAEIELDETRRRQTTAYATYE
jgi:hypothetical protein